MTAEEPGEPRFDPLTDEPSPLAADQPLDLDLRPSDDDEPVLAGEAWQPDERTGSSWVPWALVAVALLLGLLTWWFWPRDDGPVEPPAPESSPAAETPAVTPPAERQEATARPDLGPLPELSASDELVRQLAAEVSEHPRLMRWLASDDVLRRLTAVVGNIAFDEDPSVHLAAFRPDRPFAVVGTDDSATIDPTSYARFDRAVAVFTSLDVAGTVEAFRYLEPLVDEQWQELGYPGTFREALKRAIDKVQSVPTPGGELAVRRKVISWEFVDPRLESLSDAQKQLLRLGPAHLDALKRKALQFEAALDL